MRSKSAAPAARLLTSTIDCWILLDGGFLREEVDYHVILELDLRLVEGVEDWIAH